MVLGGRYRILRELGRGGMAEVSLALDQGPAGVKRLAVIKRLLPKLANDTRFTAMFLNEARIAMNLNHPNIAHIYEVGVDRGRHYLAMEFVHGVDLDGLIRGYKTAQLLPSHAAFIARDVAAALHHAHNLQDLGSGQALDLVHRDISPQNIRISHEGIIKVLDFGIAKASTDPSTTQEGVLKGKYPYMSPEQIRGQKVDGRSDLFALGVVLFEMLTYRRLFKRAAVEQTLTAVLQGTIPRPSEVAETQVSSELDQIVMRLLQRPPGARYQTAREVEGDLEAYLRSDPASAADIEDLVQQVFGPARDLSALLTEALAGGKLPAVTIKTPSDSLPTVAQHWPMSSEIDEVEDTKEEMPPVFLDHVASDEVQKSGVHTYDIASPGGAIQEKRRSGASGQHAAPSTKSGSAVVLNLPLMEEVEEPPAPVATLSPLEKPGSGDDPFSPPPSDESLELSPLASSDDGLPEDESLELAARPFQAGPQRAMEPRPTAEVAAVDVWRPVSRRRGMPKWIIVVVLATVVAAGGWYFYRQSVAEPTGQPAAPLAETVSIELEADPPGAQIRVDGVQMTSTPLIVPRSDRIYSIRISAKGHNTRTLNLKADQDQKMHIKLSPRK